MKGFGGFLANASNPFIQFCLSCIWKSHSTQHGTLQPTQEGGQKDRLQAQMSGDTETVLLLPLRRPPERVTLASLAWGWPTQLRGGVSHSIGRKSEWEPRAPSLFLAIPNIWCERFRRHHDCNFGLCHIPFPWAFRSSFFWLFSMFAKIEFLVIKIRFLPRKWIIDFFTKSWQYSSFQGWLHRSLSLAECPWVPFSENVRGSEVRGD